MYKVTNVSNKARICHDKLLQPNEFIETDKEEYCKCTRLDPHIFVLDEIKKKENKVKKKIQHKGD